MKASNAFELSPDLVERFEAMAEPPDANGCREWAGGYSENATKRTGQPRLTFCGTPLSARRVAFAIQCGQVPDPQVYIAASCHNPRCVAPGHAEVAKARPWVRPGAGGATVNGTGGAVAAKPAAPASDFAAIVERFESVSAADAAQLDAMIAAARRRIELLEFLRDRAAPVTAHPVPPESKPAAAVAKNPPATPKVKPAPTPRVATVAPVPPVVPPPPRAEPRTAGDFIDVCVQAARHIARAGSSVPLPDLAAVFGRSQGDMENLLNGLGGWFTRVNGLVGLTDRGRLAAQEE